jgi:hypothetical protein
VPRFPSKSGLIHKHIVKHIVNLFLFFVVARFIFGAPFPCKSGLVHKHTVEVWTNTQTYRETYRAVSPGSQTYSIVIGTNTRYYRYQRKPSLVGTLWRDTEGHCTLVPEDSRSCHCSTASSHSRIRFKLYFKNYEIIITQHPHSKVFSLHYASPGRCFI